MAEFIEAGWLFWGVTLPIMGGIALLLGPVLWVIAMCMWTRHAMYYYMPGNTDEKRKKQARQLRILMWVFTGILVLVLPSLWVLFPWGDAFA